MKKVLIRTIPFLLAVIMMASMAACGGKPADIDGNAVLQSILNQVTFAAELTEQGSTAALYFPDLPEGSTVKLYTGSGYYADEVALLTLPNAESAENAMKIVENHINEIRKQFSSYIPEEVGKIDKAIKYQSGKYIFICITDDYANANLILEHASDPGYKLPQSGKPDKEPSEPGDVHPSPIPVPDDQTNQTVPSVPQPSVPDTGSYPKLHSKSGKYKNVGPGFILVDNSAFEHCGYSDVHAQTYADIVNKVADALAGKTTVYDLAIPTAAGIVMPDDIWPKVPGYTNQGDAINKLFAKMNGNVVTVNCYDNLMKHRNEYLYFRTDHHWNGRGAYYAYESFCATKGITPYTLEQREEKQFDGFLGSLYRNTKADILSKTPDTVQAYLPHSANATMTFTDRNGKTIPWKIISDVSSWNASTKYSTFAGSDNPISVLTNPDVKDGSVCVVVKESYGNALMPYLVDHYSTIYEIDYRYWKGDLVNFTLEKKADDLIFANNMSMISSNMSVARLAAVVH